jgi:hypothetical protein
MKNFILISVVALLTSCGYSESEKQAIKSLESQLFSLESDLEKCERGMSRYHKLAVEETDYDLGNAWTELYYEHSREYDKIQLLITDTKVKLAEIK